ncbi:MAG: Smr/MutS family protein, partial [Bacteroidota bacterium]|nr:Smr/MutS family protein [Bacteroidota bacterium]
GAIQPKITEDREVLWEKAIHPLLFLNFQNSGKKVVPLDIVLSREKHILLISGPNAGGKSVCLQTVGLLQYMLQCGLHVPVSESSRFGIFKKLFLDFGDEQSIENDLSTYSSHLVNMKYFLKNGDSETLFLIDEFGTGTEPLLGGAIAESILEKLRELHSYGVITTHYSNLKHFASGTEGIENGAMLFDHQKMEPQFILQIGKPGSSFAFEIARGIGLPENVLKIASDAVGEEHINFDKHLREIARDKKYWENKRSRIRKSEKKLENTLEQYERELVELKAERKKILEKARKEAEDLLNGANRKIEGTIKKIREAHAEKESTMKARLELNQLREDVSRPDVSGKDDVDFRQAKVRMEKGKRSFISKEEIPKLDLSHDLKPGDKVRMEGQEMAGEVMEVHGKNYLVAFGNLITTVSPKKLQKISENEYKTHSRSRPLSNTIANRIQEKKLRFKPVIDLRGKRAEEALQMIQEFIDEAIMVEAKELSILHGKGTGVLRQMIREFLGSMDVVAYFGDEHPGRGGAGITLVKLDF